jgi:hypothetical protein
MISPCVLVCAAVANANSSQLQATESGQLFRPRFDPLQIAQEKSLSLSPGFLIGST